MPNIRSIDMRLIDELFEMDGGSDDVCLLR